MSVQVGACGGKFIYAYGGHEMAYGEMGLGPSGLGGSGGFMGYK